MIICLYPIFKDKNHLSDHIARCAWYVGPMSSDVREVRFPHSPGLSKGEPPAYLGKSSIEIAGGRLPMRFISCANEHSEIKAHLQQSDAILVWDESHRDSLRDHLSRAELASKKVIRIDHERVQYAPSFYLNLYQTLLGEQRADLKKYRERFASLCEFARNDIAYVFGTGPNLGELDDFSFSDGTTIACNSMVVNTPLMERLKPKIIVAADPIFHAGPSAYAEKFRKHLVDYMLANDCYFVVPLRDHHIYEMCLPEACKQRLVAFPFQAGETPNLNLLSQHTITTTSNVLTLFLIPLAATIAREIRIGGCDGRRRVDNKYFWEHHKKSQINEEMQSIKEAHPAFFAIDYNDYYDRHCATLGKWLDECEAKGITVRNLTRSHIPALQLRTHLANNNSAPMVSIVMPCFNAEKFIDIAIESIRSQSFNDWELIIIDDASTDQSKKIALQYADLDSRVRVVDNILSKGVSGARNTGIEQSKGEYLAFLDADDDYHPDYLRAHLRVMLDDTDVDATHGPLRFINSKGEDLEFLIQTPRDIDFGNCVGNPASCNTLVIRKERLGNIRFPEGVANGEDWLFVARVLRSGIKSKFVKGYASSYRAHGSSSVVSDLEKHERALVDVIDWICGETDEAWVSEKFREGKKQSDRDDLISRRVVNRIIWNIVSGVDDENTFDQTEIRGANKFGVGDLGRFFQLAGIRRFEIPVSQLCNISEAQKKNICLSMAKLQVGKGTALFKAASNVFKLEDNLKILEAAEREGLITNGFRRDHQCRVDEAGAVAHLLNDRNGTRHVMLDVGAHVGSSAEKFSKLGWRIVCFEPDSASRAKLIKQIGKSSNVTIDDRAVSDKTGTDLSFYASDEDARISGMLKFRDTHREIAKVQVTTVAEAAKKYDLRQIDFLKIDVEGFDFSVLKGISWDIIRPDVIECEYDDSKTKLLGHTWRDIAEYLREKGYAVYLSEWHPIVQYGSARDWRRLVRFPESVVSSESSGTILAFRNDPGYLTVLDSFKRVLSAPSAGNPVAPVSALSSAGETVSLTKEPFEISRFVESIRRFWRHNPVLVAMTFSGLVAALAGAIELAWPVRNVLWFVATLLALLGVGGYILKKSLRRKLVKFDARPPGPT